MKLYIWFFCLVAAEAFYDGELKMNRLGVVTSSWAERLQLHTQLTDFNTVSAPTVIHQCLTNVVLGAYGDTLTNMSNVLELYRFTGGEFKPHEAYSNMDEEDKKFNQSESKILYGNAIYAHPRINNFVPKFLERTSDYYKQTKVAFFNTTSLAATELEINDYIKNKTGGQIQNIVPSGSITNAIDIVLASALFPAFIWNQPFLPNDILQMPFYVNSTYTTKVDTMFDDYRKMNYTEKYSARIGELTCVGNRFAMYFLLPFLNNTLANLEKTLAEGNNSKLVFQNMKEQVVYTAVPRFRIESFYELSTALKEMGMTQAFDRTLANFYRLSRTGNFSLTKHYHKADIQVNENGTATIPGAPYIRHRGTITGNLTLNRPFLFILRDNVRNIILIQGKYVGKTN